MAATFIVYFTADKMKVMIGYSEPVMNSLTNEYDVHDEQKYALTGKDMSIPLLILMEGTGNTEDQIMKILPLDRESR